MNTLLYDVVVGKGSKNSASIKVSITVIGSRLESNEVSKDPLTEI